MKSKPSKTNKIGADSANLTVNVKKEIHRKIGELAKKSNMKLGEYVRGILQNAIDKNLHFTTVLKES